MPLIIDANRAGDFSAPLSGHAECILRMAKARQVRIVVGGKLLRELARTKLTHLIAEWGRAGRLCRHNDAEVDKEELLVKRLQIRSDDPHVLALARLARCNLLYSEDADLILDFKDRALISPRGKVVRTTTPDRVAKAVIRRHGI